MRRRAHRPRSDPDPDARRHFQVLDPIGALTAARKHVDAAVVQAEPDLDRVLFAGTSAGRREVREVVVRESLEHLTARTNEVDVGFPGGQTPAVSVVRESPTRSADRRAALIAWA